jgi:membrane protein
MERERETLGTGDKPPGLMAVARQSVVRWFRSDAPSHSAALAFYTLFSLAPVLLIVLAIAGSVFGTETTQREIESYADSLLGTKSAKLVGSVLESVSHTELRGAAGIGALVALFFGATAFFGQLQAALNAVWGVTPPAGHPIGTFVRKRLLSFGVVLALGFLLLVSLLVSTALSAFGAYLEARLGVPSALMYAADVGLFLAFSILLFAFIYRVLPDARIAWREVGLGAVVTAALFSLGKWAIAFYLGRAGLTTTYGAAGSLVLLLLWVYYGSMILLLGAGFTRAWAERRGFEGETA